MNSDTDENGGSNEDGLIAITRLLKFQVSFVCLFFSVFRIQVEKCLPFLKCFEVRFAEHKVNLSKSILNNLDLLERFGQIWLIAHYLVKVAK